MQRITKKDKTVYLYGRHALFEALSARPETIKKVFLEVAVYKDQQLMSLLQKNKTPYSKIKESESKSKVGRDTVHQGVIAEIRSQALYTPIETIIEQLEEQKIDPCIVVLDELQDPHNVGAIIRSAAAFGAMCVIIPEHNQAPLTGTVIKTSAGMVFRIPIVKVGNINQAIRLLKDHFFVVHGLVMNGTKKLKDVDFKQRTLYVVGNESEGIRQKTLELCDETLSIPMDKKCESLNAATAASIVLYEYSRNVY